MNDEYRALLAKVEQFTQAVSQRRARDLTCHSGCSGCCQAWLSVSPVEAEAVRVGLAALPSESRERIAARGHSELQRERTQRTELEAARCALLEDDGACAIYAARPLVCRTQGHALRYPAGFIPSETVRARAGQGEVTHCPLNYTLQPPAAPDVLDAERVDTLLAVVNTRFSSERGLDPNERSRLSELAAASSR